MKRITKIESNKMLSLSKKIRVAAYCRVSSISEEQLISLEAQRLHYENYIKSNDEWDYVGTYYDKGITGTKKEIRNGLTSLIVDCQKDKIDLIITKSISRFSRNTTDCLEIVRKLLDLNIYIYFEKEDINTGSMESELMLSILSSFAENESVSISENGKWSIKKRFQNGTYIIGYPPYGYANINGKMEVIQNEAEIVKKIFADTLLGKSVEDIAKSLNDNGIVSKRDSKWTSTTISGIIRNEKYTGDAVFQKTYTDNKFKRHLNLGEEDKYLYTSHHKEIITHEVFDKANAIVDQRGKEKGNGNDTSRYQNRYDFSSKIICGECGGVFKRRKHYNPSGDYVAWCCTNHIKDKDLCSMKYIIDSKIKETFLTMLNKLIFSHKIVLKPLLHSLQGLDDKDSLLNIQEYESKLEKNMEKRQVLIRLMTSGLLEPALYNSENNALILEEKTLHEKRSTLLNLVSGDRTKVEALKNLIKFVSHSEMLTEYKESLFISYIDTINVISREEIIFVLKCGLKLKERLIG